MNAMLAPLWQRNLPQLEARLELLDQAAAAEPLTEELRLEAQSVAHKLAGSLGMFGYHEGTRIARELEQALEAETPAELGQLVQALRASLFPAEA